MRAGPTPTSALLGATLLGMSACHVTTSSIETVPGETALRPHVPAKARPLAATLTVTTTGHFRLARPRLCTNDVMEERHTYERRRVRPNYATVVVGLIAASAGLVIGMLGVSSDDPSGSPQTYVGALGIGAGLPLSIGSLLGTKSERVFVSTKKAKRGTKETPCGTWPLPPANATLTIGQRKVPARIGKNGHLGVAPFDLIDAFDLKKTPSVDIAVTINSNGGATSAMRATIDSDQLTKGRAGFFEQRDIDGRVRPLTKVSRVVIAEIVVTRNKRGTQPVIEIGMRLKNRGPGDAWGVRGEIYSRDAELNGRFIYAGHVPSKQSAAPKVVIPVSDASADLTGAGIRILLRDAHNTSSPEPVAFTGVILNATAE